MTATNLKLCYGVDASEDELIIVRATRKGKRIQHDVLSAGGHTALDAMRTDARDGGAVVATAMSVRDSFTRWLKTPFSSMAKARRVLPTLLDIQLPFPLESCLYDFLDLHRSQDGEIDALAVAARRESINARLQRFAKDGLEPSLLDHEGLALWTQSVDELPLERGGRRAVVYLGRQHSAIALGDHTGFNVSHAANFVYGGRSGTVATFITRCRQALRAQFPENGASSVQWIWTGPGAEDAEATQELERALHEETYLTYSKHRDPSSFLARAVATRALTRGPLRCNLMQDVGATPERAKQLERAARRTSWAYAATGLVLCLLNVAWSFTLEYQDKHVRGDIAELASSLTGATYSPSWRGQEVLIVERSMPGRMNQIEPFSFAFGPSRTSSLVQLMSTSRASEIELGKIAIHTDRIEIEGNAKDWDSCNALVASLEDMGYKASLKRSDAVADELVRFTLEGERQP